ncbi:hypothetical protein [Geodermatophilus maliterrae]|uniref:Uncharacterized protein n=1 Tax=Geodermatophilus maliterrae TaxID=3162531 RepID=A0ABV3XF62_9ACTN
MSELSTQQRWILQPLTDVGLAHDQVHSLVLRLAFDSVVHGGCLHPSHLSSLVEDQPVGVRRAWIEVLDRLTSAPEGRSRTSELLHAEEPPRVT